jgi:class 3 adenylate cyclase/tetratricopeptide (TPR) repeat protein/TolB-like protein
MPLLTMIFTDVVGSSATKRDVSLGRDNRERDQAYLETVQKRHFELIRECCRSHGGQEVSTMGDAFFLAFEDPVRAVRCAINIQQTLAANPIETPKGPLLLRIGLHSGFPEFFEGSWHGTDVDTAARVEATATQQQILISSRTYELVRHMTDTKFYPRGQFALKGVDRTALWEVDWDSNGPRPTGVPPLDVALRRRRILRFAGASAAVLLLAGTGGYLYWRYKSGRTLWPTKPRPSVAVMEFKNLGNPEVEWLANALPEMLSTELGRTDTIRTISPEDVSNAKTDLAIAITPNFNNATLTKIRRILHSEYVISGSYVAMGNLAADHIRLDVHLQDADSGETISSFSEDGTLESLSDVLKNVGTDLRTRLNVQSPSTTGTPSGKPPLPSNPEALRLYTEGLAKLRVFDALGARDKLEGAVKLEPHLALPHLALARTWQLLGYDNNAREEARLAVESSADLPPADRKSIEAFYSQLIPDWDKAISDYNALSVLYSDEPNYALDLANTQISAGKANDALLTLAKLAKQPNMHDDPRVELSVALAAESLSDTTKQRDAAQVAAEKANRQGSRLLAAHAYWQLCSAYSSLGEFAKAEDACDHSNRSAPFDDVIKARSQTVWATVMEAQGKTGEALQMRRQVLDTARKIGSQKDVVGALQNLANLVDQQGNAKDARAYYEEAVRISRDIDDKFGLVGAQNTLAAHLYQQGDFAGAASLYRQSIEIARGTGDKGGMALALEDLGELQLQQGQLADAQQSVEKAIALQQQSDLLVDRANSLNLLADVLFARGNLADARKNLEQSLAISSSQNIPAASAVSKTGLAVVDLQEGNVAEAEKLAWEAAETFAQQKMVDNEAGARDTLTRALQEENRVLEARAELDRALKISPRDLPTRLSLLVTDALLKAREGKSTEAKNQLAGILREAEKMKLVGSSLEIRLAQAELEFTANPGLAQQQLRAVEREAREKGYLQLAAQAQRKLKTLNPS